MTSTSRAGLLTGRVQGWRYSLAPLDPAPAHGGLMRAMRRFNDQIAAVGWDLPASVVTYLATPAGEVSFAHQVVTGSGPQDDLLVELAADVSGIGVPLHSPPDCALAGVGAVLEFNGAGGSDARVAIALTGDGYALVDVVIRDAPSQRTYRRALPEDLAREQPRLAKALRALQLMLDNHRRALQA